MQLKLKTLPSEFGSLRLQFPSCAECGYNVESRMDDLLVPSALQRRWQMRVWLDDVEVSPPAGLLVRKAPGTHALDFGQTLQLRRPADAQWGGESIACALACLLLIHPIPHCS